MAASIIVAREGNLATLTLNRPGELNAFTTAMVACLERELAALAADPEVRAVIITGAGRAFCAGVDIGEKTYNPLNARTFLKTFNRVVRLVENLPQPTVAALNGAAVAGGLELALACTFRVAGEEIKLGLPEINLGLVAAVGTTYRLPRLVGFGRAVEMCLLGELINGRQAADWGLVNRAVPGTEVMAAARELAARLAKQPPVALSLVKDALVVNATPHLESAALLEILSASVNHYTEDKKEGLAAFKERRPPHFTGR
ncbi:MAG: enoyl-CoA hydratase/isomerase family protein [Deltaproteobacteria bacterium]|nr:enoyl-CoA hydratase/isomerase family protein [Deltaproteobacteria bacterium]